MDPTQVGEPAAGGDAAGRSCPACGVAAVPGAVFCRSCGERIGAEEEPSPPPAAARALPPPTAKPSLPPPSTPEPRGRGRGLRAAGAIAICLLLGAAVAAGAYFLTRDDGESGGAGKFSDSPFAKPLGGDGGERPDDGGSGSGATGGDGADSGTTEALSDLIPGRYVQAGSFRTVAGAQEEVERLADDGIAVEAIPADETDELLPGFQVLLVGPLSGEKEEARVLKQLEGAGVSGFARDLTASERLSGPEATSGDWAGTVEEVHLRGDREPRSYEVQFSIEADGEAGTVAYPDDDCGGTLELIEEDGYSLAYRESIGYGDCIDEGVWNLRPHDSELTAVWLHEGRELMVEGTVPAQ